MIIGLIVVLGDVVLKPTWGKDQPNNYNGEQNCVVLDGGRNWLWNDVGCNLDYLHYICQHSKRFVNGCFCFTQIVMYNSVDPLSCGSPDSQLNTTVSGGRSNHTIGGQVRYNCPKGHALVGNEVRTCEKTGMWSDAAPMCKCKCLIRYF